MLVGIERFSEIICSKFLLMVLTCKPANAFSAITSMPILSVSINSINYQVLYLICHISINIEKIISYIIAKV